MSYPKADGVPYPRYFDGAQSPLTMGRRPTVLSLRTQCSNLSAGALRPRDRRVASLLAMTEVRYRTLRFRVTDHREPAAPV
jgi:hypothetical protein